MNKYILIVIICFLTLVSCSSAEEATSIPLSTPRVTPNNPPGPTATESIAILTAYATKQSLNQTPISTPSDWVADSNHDDSWYFEFEPRSTHLFRIFRAVNPDPFIELNLFEYYPEFPDTSSYPVFSTTGSPILAIWSEPVWSPNGRYLAFMGAIDGPSSDLYVFDTGTLKTNRLTSGENQAVFPEWSPDGKWILHGEMIDGRDSDGYKAVWAARPDGSEVKRLFSPTSWSYTIGWVDANTFFSGESGWIGEIALRLTNIDEEQVITVFDFSNGEGSVPAGYVFDPLSGAVVYSFSLFEGDGEFEHGVLYISTPSNPYPRLLQPYYGESSKWEDSWDENLEAYVSSLKCEGNDKLFYSISSLTSQREVFCVEYEP